MIKFFLHIQSDNGSSDTEDCGGVDVNTEPPTPTEMLARLRAMEAREDAMKKEMNRLRALVDTRATLPAARRPTAGVSEAASAGVSEAASSSSGEDDDESHHDADFDDHPPFRTIKGIRRFFARVNQDAVRNESINDVNCTQYELYGAPEFIN